MPKRQYPVRNWRHHNESLVNHERLDFWLDENAIKEWHKMPPSDKKRRPLVYIEFYPHYRETK